jgi:hypothetical protein
MMHRFFEASLLARGIEGESAAQESGAGHSSAANQRAARAFIGKRNRILASMQNLFARAASSSSRAEMLMSCSATKRYGLARAG